MSGDDLGRDDVPAPPDEAEVAALVRTMALVDENIGLRAELAELRHRVEVAGVVAVAADAGDPDAELAAALARAEAAEQRLASVLSSRTWRTAQRLAELVAPLRKRRP